jgi:hypothetical protein
MLCKLVDRFDYKCILFALVSMSVVSSSALAVTEGGSVGISLEVVSQCKTPVSSYSPSSPNDNGLTHVKVECSAQTQPVGVTIIKAPKVDSSVKKSGGDVNVSVSY